MRGLDGKVALVTGGSRGLGEQAVRRFVAEGTHVVIGDVLTDEGKQLADALGDTARFVKLDVTSEDDWAEAVAFTEREFGRLDVLVNNAGVLGFGAIADMPVAEYDRIIRVNQYGVFFGMRHAIPALERAGGGAIVNVSSIEGLGGGPYLSAYTASKFAVRGMTKAAAWELGPKNIRVNSIHPGAIRTPMVAEQGGLTPEAEAFMRRKVALRRMGDPAEVAALMVFLASDDASYMTGAEVSCDGGVAASSGFTE